MLAENEPRGWQFNGEENESNWKDAYCQSHSLFWAVEVINNRGDEAIEEVCKTLPKNRQYLLLEKFIIPILKENPTYIDDIKENLTSSFDSIYSDIDTLSRADILNLLKTYVSSCKTIVCTKTNTKNCVKNKLKQTTEG